MPIHQQFTGSSEVDSIHRIHKWSHKSNDTLGWQGSKETILKCLTIPLGIRMQSRSTSDAILIISSDEDSNTSLAGNLSEAGT